MTHTSECCSSSPSLHLQKACQELQEYWYQSKHDNTETITGTAETFSKHTAFIIQFIQLHLVCSSTDLPADPQEKMSEFQQETVRQRTGRTVLGPADSRDTEGVTASCPVTGQKTGHRSPEDHQHTCQTHAQTCDVLLGDIWHYENNRCAPIDRKCPT